jgi:hypothetical protein
LIQGRASHDSKIKSSYRSKNKEVHFGLVSETTEGRRIKDVYTELGLSLEGVAELLGGSQGMLHYTLGLLKDEQQASPEAPPEEWHKWTGILAAQGLLPLFYWKIKHHSTSSLPPDEIVLTMREAFLKGFAVHLQMERELAEALNAFRKRGIEALVLKGPGIGSMLYPHPATRPCGDLDLLVLPDSVIECRSILEGLGYKSLPVFEQERVLACDEEFSSIIPGRRRFKIELHWDSHPFAGLKAKRKVADLFSRAVETSTPDLTFKTLHPVDALINAAIHLMKHYAGVRLLWIYDIHLMLKRLTTKDEWELLKMLSDEWMALLPLERSFKLVQVWTGQEPPEDFRDLIQWYIPDKDEQQEIRDALHCGTDASSTLRLSMPRQIGTVGKLRYFIRLIFPPAAMVRHGYPPSREWLLPISYIRRWWTWIKRL